MSALSAAASDEDADTIRQQRERIEELESQLEAIGAGGVGPLMPRGQAKQAYDFSVQTESVTTCHQLRQWVGLSESEWLHALDSIPPDEFDGYKSFARAIEAKLREKNGGAA